MKSGTSKTDDECLQWQQSSLTLIRLTVIQHSANIINGEIMIRTEM